MAVLAAVVWGLSGFVEKIGLRGADPQTGVLARSLGVGVAGVVLLMVRPEVGTGFLALDWRTRLTLMGGGALASVIAQLFFYRALKVGDVGRVAAVGGAWPVVAFVLSVLFLGETLTVRKGLGIFLVVLGAAFLR
ncbi:MAG TPA: EamA family transporter [Elusimicrobiota bacterium]|jgi:transporter family protein|nr:EamA family transporter [Elusimicrobiota bacterium]HMX42389.1 EamA family transporter [Elusimicrobiota bacterium]HMZ26909.1 EamA family transporter [Elusimicrobiota bacterium]HNC74684.1 EamA family transporter [Elusimicrobiota bacterium]HNG45486.1 EamA family transporter [Elusimicrobiota bacterium]